MMELIYKTRGISHEYSWFTAILAMAKGVVFSWMVCNKPCVGAGALQNFRCFVPLVQGNTKHRTSSGYQVHHNDSRSCWDKMQSCETQRMDWLKYKVIVEIHCSSDGRSDWQKTVTLRFKLSAVSSRRGHFLSSGDTSFWHKVKKNITALLFKGKSERWLVFSQ